MDAFSQSNPPRGQKLDAGAPLPPASEDNGFPSQSRKGSSSPPHHALRARATPTLLMSQPSHSRRLHARCEPPTRHVDPKSRCLALVLFGASCSVDHFSRDRFLLNSKMVAQQLVAGDVARVHSRN